MIQIQIPESSGVQVIVHRLTPRDLTHTHYTAIFAPEVFLTPLRIIASVSGFLFQEPVANTTAGSKYSGGK